jgi:hypothetical protein
MSPDDCTSYKRPMTVDVVPLLQIASSKTDQEPRVHSRFVRLEHVLVEAIAARTGTDPDRDAYPQMVAGATAIAMRVAIRRWSSAEDGRPLEAFIEDSVEVLRQGL